MIQVGSRESRAALIEEKAKRHREVLAFLNEMYRVKNHDYNDAYAFWRKEVPGYGIGRLGEKFERLVTLIRDGDEGKEESIEDTLLDLANYAIIEYIERERQKNEEQRSCE